MVRFSKSLYVLCKPESKHKYRVIITNQYSALCNYYKMPGYCVQSVLNRFTYIIDIIGKLIGTDVQCIHYTQLKLLTFLSAKP